jgi:hypothetical protein
MWWVPGLLAAQPELQFSGRAPVTKANALELHDCRNTTATVTLLLNMLSIFLEIGSHYEVQANLELSILLPQSPTPNPVLGYKCVPPCSPPLFPLM